MLLKGKTISYCDQYTEMILVVLICVCVVLTQSSAQESKLVNINQGPIIGYKAEGADVFAFYNIPYATAPTGPHKFKGPLAPPSWVEPMEAIDKGVVCPQNLMFMPPSKTIQEDCLVASIYVPNTNSSNLPVMVMVHGGAFQLGFGDAETPIHLVNTKKIIAVTFNYRVGIHGFLCLGTEDIPGNAGMKDQVALLRWVKENIVFFGGNPNDVTIAGCSAGGASTDLLMMSKLTKGLFRKVIALSGSNVGVFGVQLDPSSNARNQARKYNFENADDLNALEEFYKTASYELLMSDSQSENKHSCVIFSPCIERDVGQERFLEAGPVDILQMGDYVRYPVLYGFAEKEGLIRMFQFDTWKNDMNKNFSEFLPADLTFSDAEEREKVAAEVKKFYFGDQLINDDDILKYVDYFTDVMFVYGMLRSVTLQVEAGNHEMYLHQYSFVHDKVPFISHTNIRGAAHCSQSQAVIDEDERDLSDEYKHMKLLMREVWLNFIITGNPTPEGFSMIPRWTPANADRSPCMSFGNIAELVESVIPERAKFWDELYSLYYRHPMPPSVSLT
ncbi:unnamed protein product [Diatraea saccharalis]|uniref:Carboxylic ester hydrolase n=1 Tax=Diatraea saccharalis TaxID=40085 RepID=A0A9N9N499_9NEOP|nr:unnamed protein product [Diatraea saccharalis]